MNCDRISEMLPGLLAGALGREAEQEVLSHLAWCGACRGELAFWARIAGAVKAEEASMPMELFGGIRRELFSGSAATVLESFKTTGKALGLAGSACRLALSMAGFNL
jgi:hypothetical protein